MKELRNVRVWWRRNKTFLIGLFVLLVVIWLFHDNVVREWYDKEGFPRARYYILSILQYGFYGTIVFTYTISVGTLLMFARIKKEVPETKLEDFKGHPRLLARAEQWIGDIQKGTPRLVMLCGRSGSGKRYLAQCVAGELGVPLLTFDLAEASVLGSWGLIKMSWLLQKVEKLSRTSGCVLVLKNFTALTARGIWPGVRLVYPIHRRLMQGLRALKVTRSFKRKALERVLALVGIQLPAPRPRVCVFGLTKYPSWLTAEEFEIGHFEETAFLGKPSPEGRKEIIEYALAKVSHKDIEVSEIVDWTGLMTAGEIVYAITHDAVRRARNDGRNEIWQSDLEAVNREYVLGGEYSEALRPEEKENAAWHEAGHAVLVYRLLKTFRLSFLSIVAHTGWARWWPFYGVTAFETDIPPHAPGHSYIINYIKVCYGGMLAEEIKFKEATIGIGGDTRAIGWMTNVLYRTQFFSYYVRPYTQQLLGLTAISYPPAIERKINKQLKEWHDEAEEILKKDWGLVEALALALIEKQELSKSEINAILEGGKDETP